MKKVTNFINKYLFLIFSFLVLVGSYIRWWLAFYPALMTADSFSHWQEATTMKLTNASPYLYSLLIAFLKVFYNSPASVSLFQLILFSVIIAGSLYYFYRKGINKYLLLGILAVYALWPQFGIYNVTVWKDVLYSFISLVLGLSVYLLFIEEKLRNNYPYLVALSFISALLPLLRFNGLPFVLLPAVALLFLKTLTLKRATFVLIVSVVVYLFFNNVLFGLLDVKPAPLMFEGLTMKTVGGIYHLKNPNLSEFEKKSFSYLHTESDWKSMYSCQSVNTLFYSAASSKNFTIYDKGISPDQNIVNNWHKSVATATVKNPLGYINDRLCQSVYLFGVRTNPFKYVLENSVVTWTPSIETNSKSPILKNDLTNLLAWTQSSRLNNYIFWATWPLVLACFVVLVFAVMKKLWGTSTYILFMFVNLATTAMVVPAIDYRYVYFFYVCFPLLPAIYLLEKNKQLSK